VGRAATLVTGSGAGAGAETGAAGGCVTKGETKGGGTAAGAKDAVAGGAAGVGAGWVSAAIEGVSGAGDTTGLLSTSPTAACVAAPATTGGRSRSGLVLASMTGTPERRGATAEITPAIAPTASTAPATNNRMRRIAGSNCSSDRDLA
jgi:hypothetical protein